MTMTMTMPTSDRASRRATGNDRVVTSASVDGLRGGGGGLTVRGALSREGERRKESRRDSPENMMAEAAPITPKNGAYTGVSSDGVSMVAEFVVESRGLDGGVRGPVVLAGRCIYRLPIVARNVDTESRSSHSLASLN